MTDTTLPDPLVPADVDLRDFSWMPIEIHRLRRSKAWLVCKRNPALAFYMINLWTAAWHDTPAGSLEDDDDVLADLAMCDPAKWSKVRDQVLRGWEKASDGRLYHPVVAEKANEAWVQKQAQRQRTEAARLAREQKRLQALSGKPTGTVAASVTETVTASNGTEQTGQGPDRTGTGDSYSAPTGAGAAAASPPPPPPVGPPPKPVDTIFAVGLPMLQQANVPERNARTFLGHLRKIAKDKGGDIAVVRAIERCAMQQALDPITFLQACFTTQVPVDAEQARQQENARTTAEAALLLGIPQEVADHA